jgi:hypothetical protein
MRISAAQRRNFFPTIVVLVTYSIHTMPIFGQSMNADENAVTACLAKLVLKQVSAEWRLG